MKRLILTIGLFFGIMIGGLTMYLFFDADSLQKGHSLFAGIMLSIVLNISILTLIANIKD